MVMWRLSQLFLVSVISYSSSQTSFEANDETAIKIGAFNVQAFGVSKSGDKDIMKIVAKVVRKFDIILLQEVRDTNGDVSKKLLDLVNADNAHNYKLMSSISLGRNTYKERYVFYYRFDKIVIKDTWQYPDDSEWFARPPFALRFKATKTEIPELAFAGAHISPNDAVAEISHLVDVYNDLKSHWSLENVIFGGDFNAGCTYVRNNRWSSVALWTDQRFTWLINSCVDTTAKPTTCPYDRFVAAGRDLSCFIKPNSAGPYRYDIDFKIKDTETVVSVSDHYPIGMKLLPSRRCPTTKAEPRSSPTC